MCQLLPEGLSKNRQNILNQAFTQHKKAILEGRLPMVCPIKGSYHTL